MRTADLIIDSTERNVDLYYATGFTAPDPIIYFKIGNKKYLMLSDLEIDRGKKTSSVGEVLSLSQYMKKASHEKNNADMLDATIFALKERAIKEVVVPRSMNFVLVDLLRDKGFKVTAGPAPFYPERLQKKEKELKYIIDAQKVVFSAMKLAENMIRSSTTKKNTLFLDGKPLTSERVRSDIHLYLLAKGFVAPAGTIVACGKGSIDPHNLGTGNLEPNRSIIVDIFPRSTKTLYFGDATRTFCKGQAPVELKKMYNVVKTAQIEAIGKVRAGVNARTIHEGIVSCFEKNGYITGEKDGRLQGFFHTTGHGIGLECHEGLRISPADNILKEGQVYSIEPGLYYSKIGGVRIEDLVYVTKTGCKVLAGYPKKLEI